MAVGDRLTPTFTFHNCTRKIRPRTPSICKKPFARTLFDPTISWLYVVCKRSTFTAIFFLKKIDTKNCNAVTLHFFTIQQGFMRHRKHWELFLDLCLKTEKRERLEELLNLFLTIEEKEHLASRMQIINALLSKKLSQREISDKMKVSIAQITRGSNALKIVKNDLLNFIENQIRKNQEHEQS